MSILQDPQGMSVEKLAEDMNDVIFYKKTREKWTRLKDCGTLEACLCHDLYQDLHSNHHKKADDESETLTGILSDVAYLVNPWESTSRPGVEQGKDADIRPALSLRAAGQMMCRVVSGGEAAVQACCVLKCVTVLRHPAAGPMPQPLCST
ncbi:hypothetical protein Scep_026474 [Stephania cephalantha]|uniref:Uncharacterized protein n=1 Tax=Stephania cephalantha TaxID=152367 RepID=A0AAP0EK72_9MAGN